MCMFPCYFLNLSHPLLPPLCLQLQHARPPCPSPTAGVYPNPCPSSWWCRPTISSSANPFSFCLQFPSIRIFSNESVLHIRWSKYWRFSFSISPSNEYSGLIPLGLIGLISLLPKDSQESSPTPPFKASILWRSAFFIVQLSHPYMTTGWLWLCGPLLAK